jgi:hypothetical protein
MDEALAELAAYFRRWCELPDAELVRLAAAARSAGSRWDAIAAACDARDDPDPAGVVYNPHGLIPCISVTVRFYATRVARFAPNAREAARCSGCGTAATTTTRYRAEAGQITVGIAARHWPPGAARLPWVLSAFPA